jgi:integrase/recombinase XerC
MPDATDAFQRDKAKRNILKLRALLKELPDFCFEFFRGIEPNTSLLTQIGYAYDLRIFFTFLITELAGEFDRSSIREITLQDLARIKPIHIEMYLEYLTLYFREKGQSGTITEYENHNAGKKRKLSALRSFFDYYYKKEKLPNNVVTLVDMPKIYEKAIIRLEVDEVANLLDLVEKGEGLTETQRKYHKYTRARDLAMLSLFLGTGIRISECVGLDIGHFDFNVNGFTVYRKGGNQTTLYFGDEVRKALLDYIEERKAIQPLPGHENAFFLSLQRKRISNRAVQNLVKKYAKVVAPLKNISPHKLRSTYGTNLYQETGDIYLVADVLGHKDVNTTRKHYAALSDEKRRLAAKAVKLRE